VRDLAAYQKTELTSTVLPALLRFEDRHSMVSSIETRLPFLDYRLVEFGVGLKASLKVRDGWSKYILRKTAAQVLPASIAWRPSKVGFAALGPEREGFKTGHPQRCGCLTREETGRYT
jgi:asparagine synthase (glutamine-hydrolysing)